MLLSHWIQATDPVLGEEPSGGRVWFAVLLVSISTVAGAWLARRRPRHVVVWLAIASATMLVVTLTDLLPDVWRDAVETGVPLWVVGVAVAAGFLAIAFFTQEDHGLEIASDEQVIGRHAPGRHRRLKEAVGAALFGGMGTATAMTTHRAIEGATLALSTSAVVVMALIVHSASEGLALAALLDMADQRMGPWLVVACVSPVVGVVVATVSPLPGRVVPVLLGMVAGVLLRTSVVGLRLAVRERKGERPVTRHLAIAAVVAVTVAAFLAMAHEVQRRIGRDQNTRYIETFGHAARPPRRAVRPGELGPNGRGESSTRPRSGQSRTRKGRASAHEPAPPRPTAPRPLVGRAPMPRPPAVRTPTARPTMTRPTMTRPTAARSATARPNAGPHVPGAPGPRTPAPTAPVPRTPGGRDRAAILAAVQSGRTSLADVLGRGDAAARRLRVARLLRALPGYDASSAAALMARSGVDEKRRVGELSEPQRRGLLRALAAACRCPR